ncbi:MAG: Aminomethyltransferase [Alphaproteobacteria bacterium ADurb.Bin438]|nr:MAG: Aminomethyltransferase [Alphaproteobacteria bacterium ADurb.Bin438]
MAKTILYDIHTKLNAKIASFAGYDMPINYEKGIIFEHNFTRNNAGLFDVSHMGQVVINGSDAFMKIAQVDLKALKIGKQCYGFFTNENGGVIDDFMIAKVAEEKFFLVVNAGCKDKDFAHMEKHKVDFDIIENMGLIALQGPLARKVLDEVFKVGSDMKFLDFKQVEIMGKKCTISCSGYTGEDGYEISIPFDIIHEVVFKLIAHENVELCGLGARDSLRLEAGLCLYGHELDNETTPIEAGLLWAVPKSRRENGGFIGDEVITNQIKNGVKKKLKAILPSIPAREGVEIYDNNGNLIGKITSGTYSPCLKAPIACGYINSDYNEETVKLKVRDKMIDGKITTLPFVKHNYFRG